LISKQDLEFEEGSSPSLVLTLLGGVIKPNTIVMTQSNTPTTITLEDGRNANVFVADLNEGQELAIVTLPLLQRLAALLPKSSVPNLVRNFADNLREYSRYDNCNLKDYVDMLQNELDFHKSVNMIKSFVLSTEERLEEPTPTAEGPKTVEKINLNSLTDYQSKQMGDSACH
jgi:hypothetical protein